MICYDITRGETFLQLQKHISRLEDNIQKKILLVIVGCKSDLSNRRQVSFEEGLEFASSRGFKYFEISCRHSRETVDQVFGYITEQLLLFKQMNYQDIDDLVWFMDNSSSFILTGADSWTNKLILNGRYIPEYINSLEEYADKKMAYWFRNIDTIDTIMANKNNRWMVMNKGRILASVILKGSNKIFPYDIDNEYHWKELYSAATKLSIFDLKYYNKEIKCIKKEITSSKIETINLFPESHEVDTESNPNIQISKETERLGLNIPLFIRYCLVGIAFLKIEYNKLFEMKFIFETEASDFGALEEIRKQKEEMEKIFNLTSSINDQFSINAIEVNLQTVIDATIKLIDEINVYFSKLISIENGNFRVAKCCRATLKTLKVKRNKLLDYKNENEKKPFLNVLNNNDYNNDVNNNSDDDEKKPVLNVLTNNDNNSNNVDNHNTSNNNNNNNTYDNNNNNYEINNSNNINDNDNKIEEMSSIKKRRTE